jgi:uncharacterized protein
MSKIFYLHGGTTHSTQEKFYEYLENKSVELEKKTPIWTDMLEANFPSHQIIRLSLPNKKNADYKAWEIVFQKYIQYIDAKTIIIGFSLGASFLLKYLSEHNLPINPSKIILVAGPIDNEGSPEELCNGFASVPSQLQVQTLQGQSENMHLFYATDDPVVPIIQKHKVQEVLPKATFHTLKSRGGHFITLDFPELINTINNE